MKLIVAILQNDDAKTITRVLTDTDICITEIASSGRFLQQGASTLLISVEDSAVDTVIQTIDHHCTPSVEAMQKRATLFVLNLEHFEQR
jgi:uncharacterized protein YaaQ